uniref:Uncharacterized protein n=1 Tax=Chromera velia CCMP2878 TaxID=1169474 RepID=A0A0G4GB79_9ALVE|eukprot:Cvel_21109.t1-p1 / transcript=Cvel_21109.t1 / gene=Cvel_21109 / organism=Chromera_velia_CCMP2878 / gene_product=hypothetical protein / transcript_product=hypothetical protein / location=Cvel_scaffold1953:12192-22942(-) / protein_length=678 / sequence_SO=supercontig / SO=protein_coding / is_pseudo=false
MPVWINTGDFNHVQSTAASRCTVKYGTHASVGRGRDLYIPTATDPYLKEVSGKVKRTAHLVDGAERGPVRQIPGPDGVPRDRFGSAKWTLADPPVWAHNSHPHYQNEHQLDTTRFTTRPDNTRIDSLNFGKSSHQATYNASQVERNSALLDRSRQEPQVAYVHGLTFSPAGILPPRQSTLPPLSLRAGATANHTHTYTVSNRRYMPENTYTDLPEVFRDRPPGYTGHVAGGRMTTMSVRLQRAGADKRGKRSALHSISLDGPVEDKNETSSNLLVVFSYDGTAFKGSSGQNKKERTVEQAVRRAVMKIQGDAPSGGGKHQLRFIEKLRKKTANGTFEHSPPPVSATSPLQWDFFEQHADLLLRSASRTDAGVHALGQLHVSRDALRKTYVYAIDARRDSDPLTRQFAWQLFSHENRHSTPAALSKFLDRPLCLSVSDLREAAEAVVSGSYLQCLTSAVRGCERTEKPRRGPSRLSRVELRIRGISLKGGEGGSRRWTAGNRHFFSSVKVCQKGDTIVAAAEEEGESIGGQASASAEEKNWYHEFPPGWADATGVSGVLGGGILSSCSTSLQQGSEAVEKVSDLFGVPVTLPGDLRGRGVPSMIVRVEGHRFGYRMVRHIVGALLQAGLSPGKGAELREAIQKGESKLPASFVPLPAPACGLALMEVLLPPGSHGPWIQ